MLTYDQIDVIIEQAKKCKVLNAGGTRICRALLKTVFKQIDSFNRRRTDFRIYLHPIILEDYLQYLESRQTVATEPCLFGLEPAYFGVPFRSKDWLPPSVILITTPTNLIIRPFAEVNEDLVIFQDPDEIYLITDVSYSD